MATVPVYQQQTEVNKAPFVPIDTYPASLYADRAARESGYALQNLGKTLGRSADLASDVVINEQQEDNIRAAKQLDIDFQTGIRKILYGDGTPNDLGYFSTKGQGALDQYGDTTKAINKLRDDLLKSNTNPMVQKAFGLSSGAHLNSTMDQISGFVQQERDRANKIVSQGRIDAANATAMSSWNDPKIRAQSLSIVTSETNDLLDHEGITDPTARKQAITDAQTNLYAGVIAAASDQSADAGMKLYQELLPNIDATARPKIEQGLHAAKRAEIADANQARILADYYQTKEREKRFGDVVDDIVKNDGKLDYKMLADDQVLTGEQKENVIRFANAMVDSLATSPDLKIQREAAANQYVSSIIAGNPLDTQALANDTTLSSDQKKEIQNFWNSQQSHAETADNRTTTDASKTAYRTEIGKLLIAGPNYNLSAAIANTDLTGDQLKSINSAYEAIKAAAAKPKPLATDPDTFIQLFQGIRNGSITTQAPLDDALGNRQLTPTDRKTLIDMLNHKGTPEGEMNDKLQKQFEAMAKEKITGVTPIMAMMGVKPGPKGAENYQKFLSMYLPMFNQGLKDGKSINDMLGNPDNKDSLWKTMDQFVMSPAEMQKELFGINVDENGNITFSDIPGATPPTSTPATPPPAQTEEANPWTGIIREKNGVNYKYNGPHTQEGWANPANWTKVE